MEESVTYQAILEKGEARGVAQGKNIGALEAMRKVLFIQGPDRFGPPSDQVESTLNGIRDIRQLEDLTKRLLHASSWEDLLTEPAPRPILGEKNKKSSVR